MARELTRNRLLRSTVAICFLTLAGCQVPAIQATRLPQEFLGTPRSEMQEISLTRLRQNPPKVYQLGPGDILGLYIETVIGKADEPPPVHFPEDRFGGGSDDPALGYPVPIREDGTVALPRAYSGPKYFLQDVLAISAE